VFEERYFKHIYTSINAITQLRYVIWDDRSEEYKLRHEAEIAAEVALQIKCITEPECAEICRRAYEATPGILQGKLANAKTKLAAKEEVDMMAGAWDLDQENTTDAIGLLKEWAVKYHESDWGCSI
jgi:hypothetical protein